MTENALTTKPALASRSISADEERAMSTSAIERPVGIGNPDAAFGSDVIAETLRQLDIEYVALNPGASYRGLHDSLVNFLGNSKPQMLLCLHEEAAVAIAHGYAKVTDRPMAAAVHSNVGLFHATMAIFEAWCDRSPVLVLGATGPVDAAKRRPWIEWIHTAADQGAIVRNYTKWDDQPASPEAVRESLARAAWIANTLPKGPVYVNFDAAMQEGKLAEPLAPLDIERLMPRVSTEVSADAVAKLSALLRSSRKTVFMFGYGSRSEKDWANRVKLAEAVGARVITRHGMAATFPTDHPLHLGNPIRMGRHEQASQALEEADLIVAFEFLDLGGAFKVLDVKPAGKIVHISMDYQLHNGWSMDYQSLPPVDVMIASDPDAAVSALVAAIEPAQSPRLPAKAVATEVELSGKGLTSQHIARRLRHALEGRETCLAYLPISWEGDWWPLRHPLDYTGASGGGGIGSGPGIAVGVALALKGSGRLPVAILGDGDFMMGCTAIWTATHYRIPLLVLVSNNQSFFNDEIHQERVARMRSRPVGNKWIGQRIDDPAIDVAKIGEGQGAIGLGPVETIEELDAAIAKGIEAVDRGHVVVIDVRVQPGYVAEASPVSQGT